VPHPAFRQTEHRPWPLPDEPWLWSQTWHDLAFLHWPVEPGSLAKRIPDGLTLEEFDGAAWVGVAPFRISRATLRGVPPLPWLSAFPETNVRTYVRRDDRPGVWFFSLDADSHLGVLGGQWLFELPYVYAEIDVREKEGMVLYELRRRSGFRFSASYEATGAAQQSVPGSIEHFLTERYRLYARSAGGRLHYADIHHVPWPLQPGRAEIRENGLLGANGLEVAGAPMVHFSRQLDVAIWPLKPVR
jgi:uncharacterized protein YqjF (DUF2071 family)